ncbi:MAG: serine hydrolase [Paracoccaceae bacterium]|nr:serine hydrolase [Paracoccaceae bacterium]
MRHAIGLALVLCGAAATQANAQSPQEVLQHLLSAPPVEAQFAPAFRAAVPMAQLTAVLQRLRGQIGPVREVKVTGDTATITTDTHRVNARIALDGNGQVTLLFFQPPVPLDVTLADATQALQTLGQDVAWLVLRDGAVLSEQGAEAKLAVGSAFKLGVLQVLAEDIDAGLRAWSDVVQLKARHKSLPTGRLQTYPDGAPVTLHTAALQMIAESDNTATDLLIDILGRDRVAAALGVAQVLTTREFFALKADEPARAAYLAAEMPDRPRIAAEAAATLPAISAASGPHDPGIEWYLPLSALCALIAPLADLPLMQVNPGPVPAQDWATVAYKGGSESGVLNFTSFLRDANGRAFCVAISINDPGEIDPPGALAAFQGLLSAASRAP